MNTESEGLEGSESPGTVSSHFDRVYHDEVALRISLFANVSENIGL